MLLLEGSITNMQQFKTGAIIMHLKTQWSLSKQLA